LELKSNRSVVVEWRKLLMIQVIHTILLIVYIIVCVALTIIVLMQEGKQAGLTGAISGAAETYWGKNKGRSMEGGLILATRILTVLFIVISLLLNLKIFA
jgi:preprotein translocase subunit SecG